MHFTKAQIAALGYYNASDMLAWHRHSYFGISHHAARKLVDAGFMKSMVQSERPLHERPFSYTLYRVTEAGRDYAKVVERG
jgi:hypothetical protein